jgi:hypothetical protein
VNVTPRATPRAAVRGEGCVAADFNGDGHTGPVRHDAADDELLWNNGNGTFTEGARSTASSRSAGTPALPCQTSTATAARPVRRRLHGLNAPDPRSMAGFPTNHSACATCSS